MIQKLYQLCSWDGEEWAMILTTAGLDKVQSVWSKVIAEEGSNSDVNDDPLDRFLKEMRQGYPDTERYTITAYVKP